MSEKKKSIEIPTPWRIKRYYVYALATIVALVLPWIKVNGHHFFLLSFDKMKLDLAFVQFDMQELYLMPFLLMLLFITIFGMTVLGGRVFCGWVCPQTVFRVIYRDLIETKLLHLRKRIGNKQQEPDMSKPENKVKKAIAIMIWTVLALIAGADFMWYFVPPETFFQYLSNPGEHLTMIGFVVGIAAFLIYDIVFLKENFCIYVCPYSRVQSVLYDEHTVMAIYDFNRGGHIYDEHHHKKFEKQKELQTVEPNAECTTCEKCVTVCPTHIDIREGLQLECINCLECVDACTTVMGKLGKPSLVTWSSEYEIAEKKGKTKYFRPKIIAYMVLLVGLMFALGYMSTTKEHMLLNINKETRLYAVKHLANNKFAVENSYVFLLQNTENEPMKFFFEVIPPKGMEGKIQIVKPSKPFRVVPGVKKKKIVTLRTTEMLADDKRKDTIIPITIHAYALDKDGKPSKLISVMRHTIFVFPKENVLLGSK
ncbi:cytochrome c oxidase accessory protein CcoG [Sulfurimonas sediminis]|uniref:Cytochrome c oxidase accessory protein CcoG n=1 Tax=Sulfurimonas sediminis TaxID=2590020 RepID=A0A7M1B4G7_9BACT|nr:cytochrome c oxidase accessory protein CcoG [Sulfurimonas sediminis]QOP44614.1 cytochrome c oxidase accessory protein CcoG [Sulfurimonas sediminis]